MLETLNVIELHCVTLLAFTTANTLFNRLETYVHHHYVLSIQAHKPTYISIAIYLGY